MSDVYHLTTFDNPFDPFKEFDSWYDFDKRKGYCSLELLARIVKDSDETTEENLEKEIQLAINEILLRDFTNTFKKVKEEDFG